MHTASTSVHTTFTLAEHMDIQNISQIKDNPQCHYIFVVLIDLNMRKYLLPTTGTIFFSCKLMQILLFLGCWKHVDEAMLTTGRTAPVITIHNKIAPKISGCTLLNMVKIHMPWIFSVSPHHLHFIRYTFGKLTRNEWRRIQWRFCGDRLHVPASRRGAGCECESCC